MVFLFNLQTTTTGQAAGQNVSTHSNNILLNTFRTVQLTDLHITGTKFFLIQDGVVDYFSTGDPFGPQTPTFTADLIPVMTSNTTPSGTASASSEGSQAFEKAWNAMRDNAGAGWLTPFQTLTGWLRYDFTSSKTIEKYTLRADAAIPSRNPKDWTFEGSNDGSNWTILDTQTGITFNTNETKEFTFTNNTAYSNYRINVSANGGNSNFLGIVEFEMMEAVPVSPSFTSDTVHTLTAETEPDECHLLVFEEDVDPVVLNDDLKAYCSRDGGLTWAAVSLADEGNYDPGKRMLTGTARFTDPSTGAKKDMVFKLETAPALDLNIHGVGFEWN